VRLTSLGERWNDAQLHTPHKFSEEEEMNDATLFRIVEALIDECPQTLFSEQLADVLKVNREVLDA